LCQVGICRDVFAGPTSFAVSGFANDGLAIADLDGDGKPDVALALFTAGAGVLRGNGDGTFAPAQSVPTGPSTSNAAIVAADFNGDGKLDLATLSGTGTGSVDGVAVLLNIGGASFGAATFLAIQGFGESLGAADFDGDGKVDLVLPSYSKPTTPVLLLVGDGRGGFSPRSSGMAGEGASSVAVGDFNGDRAPDVAIGSASSVAVFLGAAAGLTPAASVAIATGNVPSPVVAGDFDGDGKLDVVERTALGKVALLFGHGDGTLAPPLFAPLGFAQRPQSIVAGDWNRDGNLDLAATLGNAVAVLLGDGKGAFTSSVYAAAPNVGALAAADLNGDGKLDLVVEAPTQVVVLLNQFP
jgi:hypothetical protein